MSNWNAAKTPYVSFDPVAQDYDATRGIPPETQLKIAARMRDTARWQPGETFLDAGVGTGRFAVPLARLGVPVVGVDISENMLAQMRANREAAEGEEQAAVRLRAGRGDLRRMPVASGAFKAVVIVHILHLIADWQAVLGEVKRALRPDGVLLLGGQGGQGSSTRGFYHDLAEARGLLAKTLGASGREVRAYLAEQGARIEKVDTGDLTWTTRIPVAFTLEMLRRRIWSSLREISDADNAALLAETEAWVIERYGSLDAIEEGDEGEFGLWAVRWP